MARRSPFGQLLYTAGAVVVGVAVAPVTKKVVRPLLVRTLAGAMLLKDDAQAIVATAKEELEDLVAEARYRAQGAETTSQSEKGAEMYEGLVTEKRGSDDGSKPGQPLREGVGGR